MTPGARITLPRPMPGKVEAGMIAGLALTKGDSREKNAESEGAGGQFYLENP